MILDALARNQAIIVESPTGSGKTTQMPVILYEAGYANNGVIGVTQPRRIAAMSVSEYITRQLGIETPGIVGYKMRFEDKTGPNTKIKIMTDGILLQEMKLDPWLSKYSLLIVDEAHERSLNIDFILGLLKRVLEARHDFKVIISSATINAQVFAEYFGEHPGVALPEVPVVKIDAVTYPITLVYDPVDPRPSGIHQGAVQIENKGGLGKGRRNRSGSGGGGQGGLAGEAILAKIEGIAGRFISEKREGDILIFLPGEKMIRDCMGRLAAGPSGKYLHLVPLYGRLGKDEQERVFDAPPRGKTKVVIATNIAETSVTIDGVTAVIDSGLSKLNYYNPRTFTSSLVEAPISKASANQRKGRAGRTREGTCYRLYSRKDFENRPLFTTEDIFRTDLSEVVLRMADLGVTAFEEFDFISPPGREGLLAAVETLNLLDALEADKSLSRIGKMMTEFPLPPRQSRIIVEALLRYPQVTEETIIAAAFLSTQSPYVLPLGEETDARQAHHRFRDPDGDFVSYLKLFRAYSENPQKGKFCEKNYLDERAMAEIANVTAQLEEIVSDMGLPLLSGGPVEDYLSAVATGLIQFVCVREGREMYRSLTADRILIHPGSMMFRMDPKYIVAGEIIRTTRMYAMSVSPLSSRVLENLKGGIFEAPGGKQGGAQTGKAERLRTFSNTVGIGDEAFEIKIIKGRKVAVLPWERLSKVKDSIGDPSVYKGLRGTIILEDKYTILEEEKLSLILTLLPSLEIDGALSRAWPREKSFNFRENPGPLLAALPLLVTPALWKAGKKELGFICLFTDGAGNYRFKCSRGFHTGLNESLSTLETMIDELGSDADMDSKDIINQTYRKLSDYLA
jgi:HrpA-like RNA helicase